MLNLFIFKQLSATAFQFNLPHLYNICLLYTSRCV